MNFLAKNKTKNDNLQSRIAGLTIVPSSTDLETGHTMRITVSDHIHRKDSFAIVVNGVILPDSIGQNASRWFVYFNRQQQMIDSLYIFKR